MKYALTNGLSNEIYLSPIKFMFMQNTLIFRKAIVDYYIDPNGGMYVGMTRSFLGFYPKNYKEYINYEYTDKKRLDWLCWLSYTEWTVSEIKNGIPFKFYKITK